MCYYFYVSTILFLKLFFAFIRNFIVILDFPIFYRKITEISKNVVVNFWNFFLFFILIEISIYFKIFNRIKIIYYFFKKIISNIYKWTIGILVCYWKFCKNIRNWHPPNLYMDIIEIIKKKDVSGIIWGFQVNLSNNSSFNFKFMAQLTQSI